MTRTCAVMLTAVLALNGAPVLALADPGAESDQFVSKEEYNRLLKRYEQLEKQMQEIQQKLDQLPPTPPPQPAQAGQPATPAAAPPGFVTQAEFNELKQEVDSTRSMAKATFPGTTKFLLTGYGATGFEYQQNGGDRLFTAQFNPLFLWQLSDRLLFEGELEFELSGQDTDLNLEQAHLSYVFNDYLVFDAGKFLNPMDSFVERYHMAWVNRLPDHPLAVYDGLLPESLVGAQFRGGFPIGPTMVNYSAFVANAPSLNTDPTQYGFNDLGTLSFDNFDNFGNHFVGGGHVGFLPIPALEIGYGVMAGNVGPPGESVSALLQSVDLNFVKDSDALRGLVRVSAQWVWSEIGGYPYDVSSFDMPLPYFYNNDRNGGYAQISYRPTKWGTPWLSGFEPVFRFDMLNQKNTPTGTDEWRYTIGLNYWLTPMTVFKTAYQIDNSNGGTAHNAFLVQFATGF
jgi:hypothetical protein